MAMKNLDITIDRMECSQLAHDIFMETSGVARRTGRKFERMQKAAMEMRKQIETNVEIRFGCQYYDDIKLNGREAVIGGQTFTCSAFELIDPAAVEGAYLYAVCAGDFAMPDENIMDQLYADIWGTAFADSVRLLIRNELEESGGISDSFGPGFYGMHVTEMVKLDALLDFDSMGIELRGSQIMVPLKSCAGLYFKVNDKYQALNSACADCLGSHTSCKLCQIYGGR